MPCRPPCLSALLGESWGSCVAVLFIVRATATRKAHAYRPNGRTAVATTAMPPDVSASWVLPCIGDVEAQLSPLPCAPTQAPQRVPVAGEHMPDLVSSDESSDSDSDESAAAAVPAVTPLPRAGHFVCSWGHAAAQGTA